MTSFFVNTSGLYYKSFTIVIYICNDIAIVMTEASTIKLSEIMILAKASHS